MGAAAMSHAFLVIRLVELSWLLGSREYIAVVTRHFGTPEESGVGAVGGIRVLMATVDKAELLLLGISVLSSWVLATDIHLSGPLVTLLDLEVKLVLDLSQVLEDVLHLVQERGRHGVLILLLRMINCIRQGGLRGLCVRISTGEHHATFLKLLEELAVLVLDFDQLLDLTPCIGELRSLSLN